ncbi:MAG: ornithine carbamoyltransferase [Candidatus Omnitrophica bacterium]|nr:ornithine carbamoyltransferase [Candidatus Omnitrophota bacterium]
MNKDLISGFDLERKDINAIFDLTGRLKKKKDNTMLKGKVVGLVFQKPSMRTRVSFEIGARQLGAHCMYLAPQDIHLGKREPVKDVARVLSRYLDAIVARTFSHEHIIELASYGDMSVINGLSDLYHPCQALADIYTLYERTGTFKGLKFTFVGDGNNVVNSLAAIAAKVGLDFTVATPKGYEPDKDIWRQALKIARETKARLVHTYDVNNAVKAADVIYTDVWTSMGQEKEHKKRLKAFKKFQVTMDMFKHASKGCYFMHCMPVHRGEEVTNEVVESKHSIVFDQAENRLHVQKAVMALLLQGKSK